jgi:hypothetical protein
MRAIQMSSVIFKNFLKIFSKNLQKSLDLFQKCATLFIMKAKNWNKKDEEIKTNADYERALELEELTGARIKRFNPNH